MKKQITILTGFLILNCAAFSISAGIGHIVPSRQEIPSDTVFAFRKSIPGAYTDFTVDNLGNLYLVTRAGQLKKLGPGGDSIAVFNNIRQYGKIHSIDVSNPLKVLLYFKDFGTIVILDRFLNTRGVVDLRKLQLFQVRAIGQSYDNNIWVFDELESRIKRIGEDGRLLDQSADLRLVFDSVPSPHYIADQNRQLYLYDPAKGVYLFDYYGAFKNRITLAGWQEFAVVSNTLYGRDASTLYRYEPGTLMLQEYTIPEKMRDAQKIKITREYLYLLRNDRLEVYAYN